jgi:hypothetical protein
MPQLQLTAGLHAAAQLCCFLQLAEHLLHGSQRHCCSQGSPRLRDVWELISLVQLASPLLRGKYGTMQSSALGSMAFIVLSQLNCNDGTWASRIALCLPKNPTPKRPHLANAFSDQLNHHRCSLQPGTLRVRVKHVTMVSTQSTSQRTTAARPPVGGILSPP